MSVVVGTLAEAVAGVADDQVLEALAEGNDPTRRAWLSTLEVGFDRSPATLIRVKHAARAELRRRRAGPDAPPPEIAPPTTTCPLCKAERPFVAAGPGKWSAPPPCPCGAPPWANFKAPFDRITLDEARDELLRRAWSFDGVLGLGMQREVDAARVLVASYRRCRGALASLAAAVLAGDVDLARQLAEASRAVPELGDPAPERRHAICKHCDELYERCKCAPPPIEVAREALYDAAELDEEDEA